jgi:hypothetical protein
VQYKVRLTIIEREGKNKKIEINENVGRLRYKYYVTLDRVHD